MAFENFRSNRKVLPHKTSDSALRSERSELFGVLGHVLAFIRPRFGEVCTEDRNKVLWQKRVRRDMSRLIKALDLSQHSKERAKLAP